jgi:hypothetical protein
VSASVRRALEDVGRSDGERSARCISPLANVEIIMALNS